MKKKGIYLIQPHTKVLKIIYNQKDAYKVKDPSTILKVNKNNIKFGQSNDLEKREEEFKEIFGSINFIEVVLINDSEMLTEFKNIIKINFEKYCLKSLKGEKKLEWMSGITLVQATNIILNEFENFNKKEKYDSK